MLNGENEQKYYSCQCEKESVKVALKIIILIYVTFLMGITISFGMHNANCIVNNHDIRYDNALLVLGLIGFIIPFFIAVCMEKMKTKYIVKKIFIIYFTFMIVWTSITTYSFFNSAYKSCRNNYIWNFMPSMFILNIIGLYKI